MQHGSELPLLATDKEQANKALWENPETSQHQLLTLKLADFFAFAATQFPSLCKTGSSGAEGGGRGRREGVVHLPFYCYFIIQAGHNRGRDHVAVSGPITCSHNHLALWAAWSMNPY